MKIGQTNVTEPMARLLHREQFAMFMAAWLLRKHLIFMLAIAKAELYQRLLRSSWFCSLPICSQLLLNSARKNRETPVFISG